MSKIKSIQPLGFPWQTQDPFLFCVHHRDLYPKGEADMSVNSELLKGRVIGNDFVVKDGWRMYHGSKYPGFPYHPHRGFETITINLEGVVDHSDSLGAAGRFMAGDVQWMTAGKGIQHSEMFPLLHQDKENTLEIFQIWLNLPSACKMVEPHFKMLWREDVPILVYQDPSGKKIEIKIVAGKIGETKALEPTPDSWAAKPENFVGVYTLKMESGASFTLPKTSSEANRSIFFYKGESIKIDNQKISPGHVVEAYAGEDIFIENGDADAYFLVLEGKPIGEPVVQRGPFVMNTQDEIREAMREYGQTQFGGWPWEETEVVHNKNYGRFAKHSDGTRENK